MALLQIYIPCLNTHLESAITQAQRIRKNWLEFVSSHPNDQINICLGLHGNFQENLDLLKFFDHVHQIDTNLGWDLNMNRGFIYALEEKPDLFWLLSVNDLVEDSAFNTIFNSYYDYPNCHLLVTEPGAFNQFMEITDVNLVLDTFSLGLISSVVYNFNTVKFAFPNSFYFGWTGWGHLSIIFKILDSHKILQIVRNDPELLFIKDPGHSGAWEEKLDYLLQTVEKYQHSYYGLFLLKLIQLRTVWERKVFTYKWVLKNYKFHNLYKSAYWNKSKDQEQIESMNWRKNQASYSIKGVSVFAWILYSTLCLLPLRRLLIIQKRINLR